MTDGVMSERRAREIVAARSDGGCEVCGRARARSMHHRIKKGQGGLWLVSNLLHVCGDGTTGCHGAVEHQPDAARALGYHIGPWGEHPASVPAWLATQHGRAWWLLDEEGCLAWVDLPPPAPPGGELGLRLAA